MRARRLSDEIGCASRETGSGDEMNLQSSSSSLAIALQRHQTTQWAAWYRVPSPALLHGRGYLLQHSTFMCGPLSGPVYICTSSR
jgi:hypothetical protein